MAVERQPGQGFPSVSNPSRHGREGLGEGVAVVAAQIAVDVEGRARQFDGLQPDPADQRHRRRHLETVFERQRGIVDMGKERLGLLETIEAAIGIDRADRVTGEGVVLNHVELQAARGDRGDEAVVHPAKVRIDSEIADIAPELLVVIDRQPLAVDLALRAHARRRAVVEGVDFAVEPVPLRIVRIDLASELHIVADVPLHAAAHPQLVRAVLVVENVVVRGQRAGVDRDRIELADMAGEIRRAGVILGPQSRHDALGRDDSEGIGRHQRRAPVEAVVVLLVFDRAPDLQIVGYAVVELP